jgi:hypothetical protein
MPMKPDYNHVSHRPYQHQKDPRLSTIGMRATGSRALYALTKFPFFQGLSQPFLRRDSLYLGTPTFFDSCLGLWFIPPKAILSTTSRMARIHSFDPDFETRPPPRSRVHPANRPELELGIGILTVTSLTVFRFRSHTSFYNCHRTPKFSLKKSSP